MSHYLVIGASSGIGKEIALQLSNDGHQVFGTFNKHEPSDEKNNTSFFHMDVLSDFALPDLPDEIAGIVYCPGSINLKPFERIRPEDFEIDYKLQVVGAIKLIQMVLPRLKRAENASILLFSTIAAQTGLPYHTQVASSKAALEGLTRALAAELAPKIRVNCIAPSLTDTPLAASLLNTNQKAEANALRHPLKRIGKAEDIAAMAGFLLSEKANWITGQILHVDGGMSAVRN